MIFNLIASWHQLSELNFKLKRTESRADKHTHTHTHKNTHTHWHWHTLIKRQRRSVWHMHNMRQVWSGAFLNPEQAAYVYAACAAAAAAAAEFAWLMTTAANAATRAALPLATAVRDAQQRQQQQWQRKLCPNNNGRVEVNCWPGNGAGRGGVARGGWGLPAWWLALANALIHKRVVN